MSGVGVCGSSDAHPDWCPDLVGMRRLVVPTLGLRQLGVVVELHLGDDVDLEVLVGT